LSFELSDPDEDFRRQADDASSSCTTLSPSFC
jgi:hypothetical protein